jgi:hypothetical protein
MKLFNAVQLFAKEAPDGYEAAIRLENGAGWVELEDPDGNTTHIDGDDLAQMVLRALELAKEHAT